MRQVWAGWLAQLHPQKKHTTARKPARPNSMIVCAARAVASQRVCYTKTQHRKRRGGKKKKKNAPVVLCIDQMHKCLAEVLTVFTRRVVQTGARGGFSQRFARAAGALGRRLSPGSAAAAAANLGIQCPAGKLARNVFGGVNLRAPSRHNQFTSRGSRAGHKTHSIRARHEAHRPQTAWKRHQLHRTTAVGTHTHTTGTGQDTRASSKRHATSKDIP